MPKARMAETGRMADRRAVLVRDAYAFMMEFLRPLMFAVP
jgi:hypothetical protein